MTPLQTCTIVYGHGTEVAGVAAAIDNSFGVVGTAPGARLYDVKIFDNDGNLYLSNALWATG